ncbi:MAG: hypothetical protein ACI9G1_005381 [Pirellulaceae bacterium]|jgi:hypothetical protein
MSNEPKSQSIPQTVQPTIVAVESGCFSVEPGADGQLEKTRLSVGKLVAVWSIGAVLAVFLTAGITSQLSSKPLRYEWNDEVQRFVVQPGEYQFFEEGIATTSMGKYGCATFPDFTEVEEPTVIFWGDSYITALQVPNDVKAPAVFNRTWNVPKTPLKAVGVGTGGWSMADIYYQIPHYERMSQDLRAHIIFVSDLDSDFEPNKSRREAQLVERDGELQFVPSDWTPQHENIKKLTVDSKFYFVWHLLKRFSTRPDLRFAVGPVSRRAVDETAVESPQQRVEKFAASYRFVIDNLKEQTTKPIIFVYIAAVPGLDNGELATQDPNSDLAKSFARICTEKDVPFINLGHALIRVAHKQRAFPRGFANSNPWTGHLNELGHQTAAQVIVEYLRDNPHVIHAN